MNLKDLVLAIDAGTQSLKALVFDEKGRLLAKEVSIFVPWFSKNPGWAEQDPAVFWNALCQACQRIWQQDARLKDRISGLALTTQRGTVINLDKDGYPLRPAILWVDQRKTHGVLPLGGLWGALFRLAGLGDTVAYFQKEAEANWIKTYEPDVWKNTVRYLLLSGYLTWRLTGEFVDSIGCQVGYLPFDYRRLKWASVKNWKWKCLPVEPRMLPELVPVGRPLGTVTQKASEETGIPKGLPLIAAAADKACEVIGSGSLEPSDGCLSYGTTATINVNHRRYIEPISLLPAYPSAVPGHYCVEVQVFRGFWMVNWFKEEFGYPERREAAEQGLAPESLFENLLQDIPPGAMGLVLQPYWSPGLIHPGPEAKGAIIGFGDVHTRAHLYRSIIEGVAYALREGKERIERRSGIPITSLKVSGGGSQSDNVMRLTADIFGIPTAKPHLYETSGLGAAISASVGLGFFGDFPSAMESMTHVGEVFEPDYRNVTLYDQLYRDVYKKMYKRLKPLYERIQEITGYPR